MFIRQVYDKKTECTRVQICETFKEGTKVKQKIVKHVGIARNPSELEKYCRLAAALMEQELANKSNYDPIFDASDLVEKNYQHKTKGIHLDATKLREEKRLTDGPGEILGSIFDDSKFGDILPKNKSQILKSLVIERISEPDSKLGTVENIEEKTGLKIDVSKVYRFMDILDKNSQNVLDTAFKNAASLYPNGIDLVCFDVTTLYFESIETDELRNFGFSKDQQFHSVQVTLALATTHEGVPVGYKLFSGKTAEITTLVKSIEEWKTILPINDAIFVADRGMYSFGNLLAISNAGYKFIVAAPLRKLPVCTQNEVLNQVGYKIQQISENSDIYWTKIVPHRLFGTVSLEDGTKKKCSVIGNVIASYSSRRAVKDCNDRSRILEKIDKITKPDGDGKKLISNSGFKKYAKYEGKSIVSVDPKKVGNDEKWDGMHGLFTNTDLTPEKAIARYKNLLMIEDSFRISKTDLKMRPVFHFTPRRIRAHVAICFIALCVIRKTQVLLRRSGLNMSATRIRETLNSVQSSILSDGVGTKIRVPSKMSDDAIAIYKAIGLTRKLDVTPVSE